MFSNIEESTMQDWDRIKKAQSNHRRREYDNVLRLLNDLTHIEDGFGLDQLSHSLQMAGRALASPIATSELVVAAICHDMAKPYSLDNHPAIAAEMLKPFVSRDVYNVIWHHGIFLADHTHGTNAREYYRNKTWFPLSVEFAKWDQLSFDSNYPTLPLRFFERYLREVLISRR